MLVWGRVTNSSRVWATGTGRQVVEPAVMLTSAWFGNSFMIHLFVVAFGKVDLQEASQPERHVVVYGFSRIFGVSKRAMLRKI